ncbi:unnamed protein product [Scytosiphon promiscuus]
MAKDLRRGSHRTKTAMPGSRRSVDKMRMTPDERRELVRAQREVMWNLQKDFVVTVVGPGDDPVPYKRQGNPDVNTPLSVRRRLALRKQPLIQEISSEYWCFPGLNPKGSEEMTKDSYLKLNRKLHLALIPDTTDEEARNSAEVDWLRDTARWGGRMTREAFGSSMFELADIWTENIDEEEYTAFLWLLLETITDTNVVPPSFKPDREIECIVDEDLSEATNRIRDSLMNEATRQTLTAPTLSQANMDERGPPRGNTLSPKLKDKHIQRLRALRQRLQALKLLRSWPLPGRTGHDVDNDGREKAQVEHVERTPVERAAGSNDSELITTGGSSRKPGGDDHSEHIPRISNGKECAEELGKNWPDYLRSTPRDEASAGRSSNGSDSYLDGTARSSEADGDAVRRIGRNRLKTFEYLGNSRREHPGDVAGCASAVSHDDERISGRRDSSGGEESFTLLSVREETAGSRDTGVGQNSRVEEGGSAVGDPGRSREARTQSPSLASAVVHPTGEPALDTSHALATLEETPPGAGSDKSGNHGSSRGRVIDNSGGVHSANFAVDDFEGGNDKNSASPETRLGGFHGGVELKGYLNKEKGVIGNSDQEAAGSTSNTALTMVAPGAASGGEVTKKDFEDHRNDSSTKAYGDCLGNGGQTAGGGGYERWEEGIASDERAASPEECAGSNEHRLRGSGITDRGKTHLDDEGGGAMPIGMGVNGHRAEVPVISSDRKGEDRAGKGSVNEGREDGEDLQEYEEVVGQWTSIATGALPVDEGLLSFQREEDPLDGDEASTVSSISGQGWRPSSAENDVEQNARGARGHEEGWRAKGSGSGDVRRLRRASGDADSDGGRDELSSVVHKTQAPPGQGTHGSNAAPNGSKIRGQKSGLSRGPREGKAATPNFRPGGGGGGGGWDGISGTTDAEWEHMIQQAKVERTRRGSPTKPARKRGSVVSKKRLSGCHGSRKGSTESTNPTATPATSSKDIPKQGARTLKDARHPGIEQESAPAGEIKARGEAAGNHEGSPPPLQSFSGDTQSRAGDAAEGVEIPEAAGGVQRAGTKIVPKFRASVPSRKGRDQKYALDASEGRGAESKSTVGRGGHPHEGGKDDKNGVPETRTRSHMGEESASQVTTAAVSQGGGEQTDRVDSEASAGQRLPEDLLARLQPVLERHNMSAVDILDETSGARDPQALFPVADRNRPVHGTAIPDESDLTQCAQAAGADSAISCASTSEGDPAVSTTTGLGEAEMEVRPAASHQSTFETGSRRKGPGQEVYSEGSHGFGHVPKGREGARQSADNKEAHSGGRSLDVTPASRESTPHRRGDGTRLDAVGWKREGTDAGESEGVTRKEDSPAGSNSSPNPGEHVLSSDMLIRRNPVDNQWNKQLTGAEDGVVGGVSAHHDSGSESATGLQQDAVVTSPTVDPILESPLETLPSHRPVGPGFVFRQSARPRTRSGSRAGVMRYGSTGNGSTDADYKERDVKVGPSGAETRNDENGTENHRSEHPDAGTRSNLQTAGDVGFSSPESSARGTSLDSTSGRGGSHTDASQSANIAQHDQASGSFRSPPSEDAKGGVKMNKEAGENETACFPPPLLGEPLATTVADSSAVEEAESTDVGIGPRKEVLSTALGRAKEKAEETSRRAAPGYLSSSERTLMPSDEAQSWPRPRDVDSSAVTDGDTTGHPPVRDSAGKRPIVGRKRSSGRSMSVAGKKMSIDAENAGGQPNGKLRSKAKKARDIIARTEGVDTSGILRRSSSTGVWRYDCSEDQHGREQSPRPSANALFGGTLETGRADPVAMDGRPSSLEGSRIDVQRKRKQPSHPPTLGADGARTGQTTRSLDPALIRASRAGSRFEEVVYDGGANSSVVRGQDTTKDRRFCGEANFLLEGGVSGAREPKRDKGEAIMTHEQSFPVGSVGRQDPLHGFSERPAASTLLSADEDSNTDHLVAVMLTRKPTCRW